MYSEFTTIFDILVMTTYLPQTRERLLDDSFMQEVFKGSLLNNVLKAMAPHSSTLAWKIPWTEENGGLQSMES